MERIVAFVASCVLVAGCASRAAARRTAAVGGGMILGGVVLVVVAGSVDDSEPRDHPGGPGFAVALGGLALISLGLVVGLGGLIAIGVSPSSPPSARGSTYTPSMTIGAQLRVRPPG